MTKKGFYNVDVRIKEEDCHYHFTWLSRHFTRSAAAIICLVVVLSLSVNGIVTTLPMKTQIAMGQLDDSSFASGGNPSGTPPPSNDNGRFQQTPNYLVYSNPPLGFKIGYPAGSRVEDPRAFDGVLISIPGAGVAGVSVLNNRFSELTDFVESDTSAASQRHPDLQVVRHSQGTLSDQPAEYVISTYTNERGTMMKMLNEYVIAGDRAYHLLFMTSGSASAFAPIITSMLQSFEIMETSSSPSLPTQGDQSPSPAQGGQRNINRGDSGVESNPQDTSSARPLQPIM
jgi:hypothetical protein